MYKNQIAIPQKLLIFRNGNIGNTLVAEPLIRALKEQLGCNITVVADKIGCDLLSGNPQIDRLIEYNKRTTHKGFWAYCKFILQLRKEKFDTTILLKRFFRNELIAYLAGIPVRLGFASDGVKNFKLTATLNYSEEKNIVEQNLLFLDLWQLTQPDQRPRIYLSEINLQAATEWLKEEKLTEKAYLICHFGGDTVKNRRWSLEKYSLLISKIATDFNLEIVLLSTGHELAFNQSIKQIQPEKIHIAHNLALKTSCALIQKASYFIGNDSGPSHLAEAVGQNGAVFYTHASNVTGQINKWKPAGENFLALYSADGDLNNLSHDLAYQSIKTHYLQFGAK